MTIVIFHSADYDGKFSASACKKFLPHDTKFIGWDYGDSIPLVDPEDNLYIVDLSIEPLMNHKNLIWIDHHKSAIDKFNPEIQGYRIDGVAASRLCWQWFIHQEGTKLPDKEKFISREVSEPYALQLVGEFDVWDHSNPDAIPFQYGLESENAQFENGFIDHLLDSADDDLINSLIEKGRAIFNWLEITSVDVMKKESYIRRFEGINFCVIGSAHAKGSLWMPTDGIPDAAEALMRWKYNGNNEVSFSLYHAPGHKDKDLSIIASKYGGGGHRGACGFKLSIGQALDIIK